MVIRMDKLLGQQLDPDNNQTGTQTEPGYLAYVLMGGGTTLENKD